MSFKRLLISITFGIVSNISDTIQISKLSKFMQSSIVWILGIILTIFVCTLSIEGTLSSSVDGMTAKTAKAASDLADVRIVHNAKSRVAHLIARVNPVSYGVGRFCDLGPRRVF